MPRPAKLPPLNMTAEQLAQRLLRVPMRSTPDTSNVSRSSHKQPQ